MEQIGEKARFFAQGSLKEIPFDERPEVLPPLGLDDNLYAGVDNGQGEVIYQCENLGEFQQLHDFVKAGNAKSVTFYIGK